MRGWYWCENIGTNLFDTFHVSGFDRSTTVGPSYTAYKECGCSHFLWQREDLSFLLSPFLTLSCSHTSICMALSVSGCLSVCLPVFFCSLLLASLSLSLITYLSFFLCSSFFAFTANGGVKRKPPSTKLEDIIDINYEAHARYEMVSRLSYRGFHHSSLLSACILFTYLYMYARTVRITWTLRRRKGWKVLRLLMAKRLGSKNYEPGDSRTQLTKNPMASKYCLPNYCMFTSSATWPTPCHCGAVTFYLSFIILVLSTCYTTSSWAVVQLG